MLVCRPADGFLNPRGAQIHWFAGCWWNRLSEPCSDPKMPLVSQIPHVEKSILFHIILGSIYCSIYRSISPCLSYLPFYLTMFYRFYPHGWNEIHASIEEILMLVWLNHKKMLLHGYEKPHVCRSNQYSCQLNPSKPIFFGQTSSLNHHVSIYEIHIIHEYAFKSSFILE